MTLVIGASGLIGSHMMSALSAANEPAIGTYRNCPVEGLMKLDMSHRDAVDQILSLSPNACVYAAGFTWVDGCENQREKARAENFEYPLLLANACVERDIHFTYFSTSYVFDGSRDIYHEDDERNPINVYGQTKSDAEIELVKISRGNVLIPRIVCAFGVEKQMKNFVYQVLRAAAEGRSLRVPVDQFGNPTPAKNIGNIVTKLITQKAKGLWHIAREQDNCSRLDWAKLIVSRAERQGLVQHGFKLEPSETWKLQQTASRPLNAGMTSEHAVGEENGFISVGDAIDEIIANYLVNSSVA